METTVDNSEVNVSVVQPVNMEEHRKETSPKEIKQMCKLKCLQCRANVLELPENSNGTKTADSFFHSVAKALSSLQVNEEVSAKMLREVCHQFSLENDWVKTAVINDARSKSRISGVNDENIWNAYLSGIRCTADDIEEMERNNIPVNQQFHRTDYGETLAVPIRGRPEIEGRMVCERYSVKLHVVEKRNAAGEETQLDEIIEKLRSASVNDEDDGRNTIHIVNKGNLHFVPVLSTSKFRHGTQQRFFDFPDCDDSSDDSQGKVAVNENLISTVLGSSSEREKIKKLEEYLTSGADINFKDANRRNNTALHFAVKKSEVEVVTFLVGKGANANIRNDKNETPLSIAQQLGRYEIITLLELESCQGTARMETEGKQNQKITFNKAKGSTSTPLFNVSLATLFLLKGLSDQIDSFYLASKMEDAGKFGDIVMKYEYRNTNISKIVFLGVQDDTDHVLAVKELLQDSLKLQEYFACYLHIKKQFLELNRCHPIFSSKFNDCEFIICASASSDFGASSKHSEESVQEVSVDDDVLNFSDDEIPCTGHCYKLIYDVNKNEMVNALRYSTDCHKLAMELAKSGFGGVVDIKKPIIQNYHFPLVEKVLEMKEPGKGKFRHSFLNNDNSLSAQDIEFRKIFFHEAKRVYEMSEEKVKSELYSKNLKIPSEFWITFDAGRSQEVLSLPCSVDDDDVKAFLSKLKIFALHLNREKLKNVLQHYMQKLYDIESNDADRVFAEVELRVQNWYLKEKYYLTKNDKLFQHAVRKSIRFDVKAAVPLFTGRAEELLELHRALHKKDAKVRSQVVSIMGLDGVGKRELAKKYISVYGNEYDNNIIWINAATHFTIEESFRRLAQEILGINIKFISGNETSIKAAVSEIYDYFAKKKRKSLFVFCDAKSLNEGEDAIDKFLPPDSKTKPFILIISHNQGWPNIKTVNLDSFTDVEATEFVKKALQGKAQESKIRELVQLLKNFPLALSQAVAYLEVENKQRKSWCEKGSVFTVGDYVHLYKEKGKELAMQTQLGRSQDQKVHCDQLTEVVFRTSTVTLDKILQHQYGKEAVKLLSVTAYIASHEIPADMFFSQLSEEVLHTAAELLDRYSMITLEHGKLNPHKMVQHVTRMRLEKENTVQNVASLTLKFLKECFFLACRKSEDIAKLQHLMPHLKTFLEHLDNWKEKNRSRQRTIELSYIAVVLNFIGSGYVEMSNPKNGKKFLERALSILDKHHGPKHPQVAKMQVKLSNVYGGLGNPQKQKQLAERALPVLEEHYGRVHIEIAMALQSLGIAYCHLGVHKKGKDLLVRALTIWVNHLECYHPSLGTTLLNLSTAFEDLGDYQRQIELTSLALPLTEKYYGQDHFKIAITLQNLACAHGNLGDPRKEKDLLERALPVLEKHFGRESYTVAVLLKSLGSAYADLGDYERSKELLKEALSITEREFGPKHFNAAAVLEVLGIAYGGLGNPQKHKELLEKALHIYQKHYGRDSPRVALASVNLSKAYTALGFPQQQKKLLDEAFPVLKQHYGNGHYVVGQVLALFGCVHGVLGNYQKSKQFLEQALPILQSHFGAEHYQVGATTCDLGNAYRLLGYPDKQIKLCEQGLPILEKHYGHNSPNVAVVLINLSESYAEFRIFDKQKELLEQALHVFERHYGPNHYEVARVRALLSNIYGDLDRQIQKTILEQVLPVLQKHFGLEHYELAGVLCELGMASAAIGDPHEGIKLVKQALCIFKKHYGHEHVLVAEAKARLGKAYGYLGDYKRQKELYEQALPILETHYGRNHYKVALQLLDLATALYSLNDPHKQKELVHRALPILEKHYGPEHGEVGMALGILGKAYAVSGDFFKEKECAKRGLRIMEKQYGRDHYNTAVALEYLAAAYGHLDNHQKCKELLERALTITERSGGNQYSVGVQLRNLSSAYWALGDREKEKDLLERALPILESHVGLMHWKMASVFVDLGRAYGALCNYRKQKEMLERALLISEKHYGKDHAEVGDILMNFSVAYGALGDYRKQKELTERALPILANQWGKEFYEMCEKLFADRIFANMDDILNEKVTPIRIFGQLHLAARNGDLDGIRNLIECGSDVNMRDNIGLRTPLHFASESGHLDIVNLLLNKADIEAGDVNDSKPLHYAARNNNQDVVQALLRCGANVNALDSSKNKPLDCTTNETVQRILRATGDLFDAVAEQNLKRVKKLVRMGGIINAVSDSNRLSAMHCAAHSGSCQVIQFLVNKGGKVNVHDKDGWTPLHYAAQRGQTDIVMALMNGGADIHSKNDDGESPLYLSWKYGNLGVLDLLTSETP